MTDVPTPRTDAEVIADGVFVFASFARTLEREIAQQAARIDSLTKALEKRVKAGHNDTCDARLLSYDKTIACSCGHAEAEVLLSPKAALKE